MPRQRVALALDRRRKGDVLREQLRQGAESSGDESSDDDEGDDGGVSDADSSGDEGVESLPTLSFAKLTLAQCKLLLTDSGVNVIDSAGEKGKQVRSCVRADKQEMQDLVRRLLQDPDYKPAPLDIGPIDHDAGTGMPTMEMYAGLERFNASQLLAGYAVFRLETAVRAQGGTLQLSGPSEVQRELEKIAAGIQKLTARLRKVEEQCELPEYKVNADLDALISKLVRKGHYAVFEPNWEGVVEVKRAATRSEALGVDQRGDGTKKRGKDNSIEEDVASDEEEEQSGAPAKRAKRGKPVGGGTKLMDNSREGLRSASELAWGKGDCINHVQNRLHDLQELRSTYYTRSSNEHVTPSDYYPSTEHILIEGLKRYTSGNGKCSKMTTIFERGANGGFIFNPTENHWVFLGVDGKHSTLCDGLLAYSRP